jgi:hypothetical protein
LRGPSRAADGAGSLRIRLRRRTRRASARSARKVQRAVRVYRLPLRSAAGPRGCACLPFGVRTRRARKIPVTLTGPVIRATFILLVQATATECAARCDGVARLRTEPEKLWRAPLLTGLPSTHELRIGCGSSRAREGFPRTCELRTTRARLLESVLQQQRLSPARFDSPALTGSRRTPLRRARRLRPMRARPLLLGPRSSARFQPTPRIRMLQSAFHLSCGSRRLAPLRLTDVARSARVRDAAVNATHAHASQGPAPRFRVHRAPRRIPRGHLF